MRNNLNDEITEIDQRDPRIFNVMAGIIGTFAAAAIMVIAPGCNTERKLQRMALKHPEQMAVIATKMYPVKTKTDTVRTFVKGPISYRYDTVTTPCPPDKDGKVVYVKAACPPCPVSTPDTIVTVVTNTTTNTAEIALADKAVKDAQRFASELEKLYAEQRKESEAVITKTVGKLKDVTTQRNYLLAAFGFVMLYLIGKNLIRVAIPASNIILSKLP